MNISYHAWKDYLNCPKKYYLKDKTRTEPPYRSNLYNALYGMLTEKFFTMYSNYWRLSVSAYFPKEEIKVRLTDLWDKMLRKTYVDWSSPYAESHQR